MHPALASVVLSVVALPLVLIHTLSAWVRRTESRRQLLEMDQRLLEDIGITRADAEREARKPFWRA